jgi:hypothetical protein
MLSLHRLTSCALLYFSSLPLTAVCPPNCLYGHATQKTCHVIATHCCCVTSPRTRKLRARCIATVRVRTQRKHRSSTVGRDCVAGVAQQWVDTSQYLKYCSNLTENIPRLHYKDEQFNVVKQIAVVYSENHTKHNSSLHFVDKMESSCM